MANDLARGAVFLLLGELMLAIMAALIKHLSSSIPHETLVFARNLFGLLFLMPLIAHKGFYNLKTQRFGMHLLRALTGLSAMYGYFYVISYLPLAEATLVKLSSPFFLPIVTLLWLGEKINTATFLAIILGFIGVLLVLRPGSDTFQPVALIGILSAALASVAKVTIRRIASTEPEYRIVFYFSFLGTLVSSIPLLWSGQMPSLSTLPWLAGVGFTGTVGQLLMTKAYRIANPGQVGPYTYTAVIYAAGLGWFFWDEVILLTTLLGSALIVVAGAVNMRRNAQKG